VELILTPDNPAPPGAFVASVRAADGLALRVARWHPLGFSIGTVVVATGRAEYIEKYFETIGELLARKLTVVAFDWRGQGLSARELDNSRKGHIDDFTLYERDIEALTLQTLETFCPKPWFALAHSMGGSVLIQQARRGRSPFERIVAIAPLVDIYGLRFPRGSRLLAEILDTVGLGGAFIPGGGETSFQTKPFAGNRLTSDPRRYARNAGVIAAAPHLGLGDPTIGWVNAAFRLMEEFADPEYARRTTKPVLVIAAGADRVVDTAAAERFALRLKAGRLIVIPYAAHEVLMERDVFREQFWAAFDAFIPGTRAELEAFETSGEAMGAG
jgi:lysophospholipase